MRLEGPQEWRRKSRRNRRETMTEQFGNGPVYSTICASTYILCVCIYLSGRNGEWWEYVSKVISRNAKRILDHQCLTFVRLNKVVVGHCIGAPQVCCNHLIIWDLQHLLALLLWTGELYSHKHTVMSLEQNTEGVIWRDTSVTTGQQDLKAWKVQAAWIASPGDVG